MPAARAQQSRARVRQAYGMASDAVVFGAFGGLTPEKRLPQVLAAFSALRPYAPDARLLLAGAPAAHYDIAAGIAALGLQDRVTVTGYLDTDAELTDHLAAVDVSLNLRWPTARETSGPWLRALAAGRATIVTDLLHVPDLPSLDPRTWRLEGGQAGRREDGGRDDVRPVCVAVDVLDEAHSLRLAMRRLAADGALRERLGEAALAWWRRHNTPSDMVDDYIRVMAEARRRPDPAPGLPAHLRPDGQERLRTLLASFGLEPL